MSSEVTVGVNATPKRWSSAHAASRKRCDAEQARDSGVKRPHCSSMRLPQAPKRPPRNSRARGEGQSGERKNDGDIACASERGNVTAWSAVNAGDTPVRHLMSSAMALASKELVKARWDGAAAALR